VTNFLFAATAWIALALHIVVGIVTLRSEGWRPWLPLLNLTIAVCVLAYWASRWYGYLFRGVIWYASDQVIPLYALLVCVLAVLSLTGRSRVVGLNWAAFTIHVVVAIGAVLFVTFLKMRMF
jgi:hypothetical protein